MPRVYFDGSHRPRLNAVRWAILAYLPDGRTIVRHGPLPATANSYDAELHALRVAKRLARHLARTHGTVTILGDHDGLIQRHVDTPTVRFDWVPSSENRAHFWSQMHPLPQESTPPPFRLTGRRP